MLLIDRVIEVLKKQKTDEEKAEEILEIGVIKSGLTLYQTLKDYSEKKDFVMKVKV